ncbi:MAG: DUF4874 domain-containing protein [Archangium sp.]
MRALFVVAVSLAFGCSGSISELPDGGGEGAGMTVGDAGNEFDAGTQPDAGMRSDAGMTVDAGVSVDAGSVTATFSPTTASFPNPERGWYVWASSDFGASLDVAAIDDAYDDGVRIVYAMVNLQAFRTSAISQTYLDALSARLATLRSHGVKAVLRFVYDYTAGGNDATASRIASHLQQLAPVLSANADAIAIFQAGFIGAWGEWHSSKNSNSYGYMTNAGVTEAIADANRLVVRDAIYAAVPAGIPVAFRYPGDLIKWYPSASQQSRAGLHNDCWLAGPNDTGTYDSQAQRTYIAALSANAAFGGETCDASNQLRTSCDDVRSEGAQYHLAYLNSEYFDGFFTSWMSGGCYDEVGRTMGYRLQLDALRHPARAAAGATVRVEVDLRNVGWAKLFSARPLMVKVGPSTASSQLLLSSLASQATTSTTVSVDVALPSSPGTYAVELSAPDVHASTATDARFAIRFANADAGGQQWNATRAAFVTGTSITVE